MRRVDFCTLPPQGPLLGCEVVVAPDERLLQHFTEKEGDFGD